MANKLNKELQDQINLRKELLKLSYEEQSKISHRKKAIERFLNSPLVLGRLS